MTEIAASLRETPLHSLHERLGARMIPFAGYDMPLQYQRGIIAEHLHARAKAALFDVSHMGQALLTGPRAGERLETLAPADIADLDRRRMRYTQFLDENGKILDDLMIARMDSREERFFLVVNAATKAKDFVHLRQSLPDLDVTLLEDRALIALQGPRAVHVLASVLPGVEDMAFMDFQEMTFEGAPFFVSRSGYTGEDGFEISTPARLAQAFAERLLAHEDAAPAGLGARDSLRLEAGLCLYGHDIDETTDPIEAGLLWSIGKRRREQGGFPGFARLREALENGPSRQRVGLLPQGKAPVRDGAALMSPEGRIVGRVTSGGYSPSLSRPIAMGYVEKGFSAPGVRLSTLLRGALVELRVTELPFVAHRYFKGSTRKG